MKHKGCAVVVVAGGVLMILFGLLFLVGASGQARRVVIGIAGLGLGAVAAGCGVRALKLALAGSEERIRAQIMALAERHNGEISEEEIAAELGTRAKAAEKVLQGLLNSGICRRENHNGGVFYIFPKLQPRLLVRYCTYCKTEFDLTEDIDKCPNCAGPIETRVASFSMSTGGYFHMDQKK